MESRLANLRIKTTIIIIIIKLYITNYHPATTMEEDYSLLTISLGSFFYYFSFSIYQLARLF